ncbi:LytTR family DNA-binding domain-containing protein [uncultured Bacteroides sp.]|uniref:LytR/AlgR family response regulator transcription factor n=1 Tax=uncultured Bacteroides sp. TaxID=162156 RepID=UPI002AAA6E31|nr:LytTR family DNA-binding domain-containing protein [uncultured Bacteroides sp.]
MNIVIIEDERITADELAGTINNLEPEAKIVAILGSVKTAVAYFQKNESPDLIFSDVQLGDGLSFEIFKAVKISAPVIFCTAYDEYALNAFKTNGIDYILKPSTSQTIADALAKYRSLRETFGGKIQRYDSILDALIKRESSKYASILVYHKEKILPVKMDEIALFYIDNEVTYLLTFASQKYVAGKTLEELEQLSGSNFFRINRQYLVNRKAVIDASRYFLRKLSVNLSIPYKEKILVSKEKTPLFLNWLEMNS